MYDYKKTLKKGFYSAIIVFCAGLLSVYGDHQGFLAFIPLVEGIRNYVKHK